jgi:hypothetical protein
MEIIVIFIVVGCIAWVVWAVRQDRQALDKESLDRAWRKVLNDPHYMERRQTSIRSITHLQLSVRTGSLVSGGSNGLVWRQSTGDPCTAGLL